jgi:hypothetical protein
MHPKVKAAGFAGAVTAVVITILGAFGVDLPPEVATAVTTLIAVLAGHFKIA